MRPPHSLRAPGTLAVVAIIAYGCAAGGSGASSEAGAAASGTAATTLAPTSAPSPTLAPTASPTPEPTATPEPTPDVAAMADAYAASAKIMFDTSFALDARFADAKTYDDYSALYAEGAEIYEAGRKRTEAMELLPALAEAKADLIAALAIARDEFLKLADDPDYDPKKKLTNAQKDIREAGAVIREALGLPPAPTPKP